MQALTVAVGPAGVTYFAQQLVAQRLVSTLAGLKPADNNLTVPDFSAYGYGWSARYSNIHINLSNGSLSGFSPAYQSLTQQAGGAFTLVLTASNFTANYKWVESYHEYSCYSSGEGPPYCSGDDDGGEYGYGPRIGTLTTTVGLAFVYNQTTKSYDVNVVSSNGQSSNVTPNIPGKSVIQNEDQGCFTSNVSDATARSVSTIDFTTPISQIIPPVLRSIPASGQLTPDIKYEFELGDSGLTFPGNQGIAVGVTGKVSWKGQYYPGQAPAALPVPPPPAAPNHVQVYVSDYEVNALHWAYFQAGLLNVTVRASDLSDPDILKVKTYVPVVPAFQPYASYAMQAQVSPNQPPVVAFQTVWSLTGPVMTLLQTQLPSTVYNDITGLEGNAYVAVADLESDLAGAGVAATYYPTIERAAQAMGMVVTQNLRFTLTILNNADPQPNLVFDVARTDILDALQLGQTGTAQTLKYGFTRVQATATFVSTTVPKFNTTQFGTWIWPVAGEPRYDEALTAMGQTGVPIPIMEGFQFLFQQAQLSIQQGYVSILSQVAFKG